MEWRQRTLALSVESASSPNMCATNSDTVSMSDKARENQCLCVCMCVCETEGVIVSECVKVYVRLCVCGRGTVLNMR